MSTAPRSALSGRAVAPTHLESLGKTAARLADSNDISLTSAVIETIGSEKLNSEQVRRVVEHANTEAFNRKFASTSGSMRAVHIDGGLADPVEVLQALEHGARPREVIMDALEYAMPPSFGKTSSAQPFFNAIDRTPAGVMGDVRGMQHKLASAHEQLIGDLEASKAEMNSAIVKLAESVRQASLQGASPQELFETWTAISPELAKVAVHRTKQFMIASNTKVAGRGLNPQHAVVQHFDTFVKAAQSFAQHHEARQLLEAELVKVNTWLKQRAA